MSVQLLPMRSQSSLNTLPELCNASLAGQCYEPGLQAMGRAPMLSMRREDLAPFLPCKARTVDCLPLHILHSAGITALRQGWIVKHLSMPFCRLFL